MKPIYLLLCLLTLALSARAQTPEAKPPLLIEAPAGWKLKYQGTGGIPFYSLQHDPTAPGVLMISRWPAAGGKAEIPTLLDAMAASFLKAAAKSKEFKLTNSDYKIEDLTGDTFSGSFVFFAIEGGFVQTIFMVSDGDGLWNGQFTGSKELWLQALEILKKIKRNP